MLGTFLGFRELDFTDKDGKPVRGLQLCITQSDTQWTGETIASRGKVPFPFVPYGSNLYNKLIKSASDMIGQAVDVDFAPSGGKLTINDINIADWGDQP